MLIFGRPKTLTKLKTKPTLPHEKHKNNLTSITL